MEIDRDAVTSTYVLSSKADLTRERFRRARLAETLGNAWKLEPYRTHWKQPPPAGDDVAGYFRGVPSIEKRWVVENLDGLLVDPDAAVENVLCSTGTSGNRMFRLVTTRESQFRDEFFGKVAHGAGGERPLMLRLGMTGHGTLLSVPGRPMILHSTLHAPWDEQALDFLRRTFAVPGVESRVGTLLVGPWQLMQLAALLTDVGIAPQTLAVHTVLALSAPVTPALRTWFTRWWPGINLVERFSLSEVFGGATYADQCGAFHTDLHVLPEFQPYRLPAGDPGGGEDLGDRVSELWLTELYPFSQGQPLIRYRTKDLVVRKVCACGRSDSFQFLGRDIGTVLAPDGLRALLTSMEVTEAWYDHLLSGDGDPSTWRIAAASPTFHALDGTRARLTRHEAWSEAQPEAAKRIDRFLDWLTATAAERGVELEP